MVTGGVELGRRVLDAGLSEVSRRAKWAVAAIGAITFFAMVGSVTTPVIDGEPVLFFSQAAKVQTFAEQVEAHMLRLGEIDEMFSLDQNAARLRIRELEAAYEEVGGWATSYSSLESDDLPADELVGVELLMEQATGAALRAIDLRLQWVKSNDPVAKASSDQWRASYIEVVLEAGRSLDLAARTYGVTIRPTEQGAVE